MADLNWQGNEVVLDIGCGNGLQTLLIGQHCGKVIGLDTNPEFIDEARWFARHLSRRLRAEFIAGSLEKAGFAAATFDRIFSICVIEHIPNYEEVLAESWRVLKPGGQMVFSVDTLEGISDPKLIKKHLADHKIVRYFRSQEVASLLTEIGFVEIQTQSLFRSPMARELFSRGIQHGFNFGRLQASSLARQLAKAEAQATGSDGLFLAVRARKPSGFGSALGAD
jgi:ubiquinone/menaquinone biosynthesis C-methylase UbiE